jgi:hypothetical protein
MAGFAGFPKVRMLELELFQCLNRQLGYAGRLGVVAIELPLPARGSQTVGAVRFSPHARKSSLVTSQAPEIAKYLEQLNATQGDILKRLRTLPASPAGGETWGKRRPGR